MYPLTLHIIRFYLFEEVGANNQSKVCQQKLIRTRAVLLQTIKRYTAARAHAEVGRVERTRDEKQFRNHKAAGYRGNARYVPDAHTTPGRFISLYGVKSTTQLHVLIIDPAQLLLIMSTVLYCPAFSALFKWIHFCDLYPQQHQLISVLLIYLPDRFCLIHCTIFWQSISHSLPVRKSSSKQEKVSLTVITLCYVHTLLRFRGAHFL